MKKALVFLAVLLVLFLGAVAFVAFRAGSLVRAYQPEIEARIAAATGWDVALGELSVSLFPPSAKSERLHITGEDGLELDVAAIRIVPELMPLLQRRVVIDSLLLDRPVVKLAPAREREPKEEPPAKAERGEAVSVDLRKVEIRDGRLVTPEYELQEITGETGLSFKQQTLDLGKVHLSAKVSPQLPVTVRADLIEFNLDSGRLNIDAGAFRLPIGEFRVAGSRNPETGKAGFEVAGDAAKLADLLPLLDSVGVAVPYVRELGGRLRFEGLVQTSSDFKEYTAQGSAELDRIAVTSTVASIAAVSGPVSFSVSSQGAELAPNGVQVLLQPNEQPIRISGTVQTQPQSVDLSIEGEQISLEALKKAIPLAASTLDQYGVRGTLAADADVQMRDGALVSLTGFANLLGVDAAPPQIEAPIREAKGRIDVTWQGQTGTAKTDAIRLSVPGLAESVSIAGTLDLPKGNGSVSIDSSSVALDNLARVVPTLKDALSSYRLAGSITPKARVSLSEFHVQSANADVGLQNLEVQVPESQAKISNATGQVQVGWQPKGPTEVSTERIRMSVNGAPAEVHAKVSVPAGGKPSGKISLSSQSIPMQVLAAFAPALRDMNPAGTIKGNITISLQQGAVGAADGNFDLSGIALRLTQNHNLTGFNAAGVLKTPKQSVAQAEIRSLQGKLNEVPFTGTALLSSTPTDYEVQPLRLQIFGGNVTGEFFTQQPPGNRYALSVQAKGLNVEQFMQAVAPAGKQMLAGTIESVTGNLKGSRAQFWPPREGGSKLILVDGKLVGINIGRMVFEKVGGIPLIGANLLGRIPPEFEPYFEGDDTPVRRLELDLAIDGERIRILNFAAASDAYGANGQGSMTHAGMIDFQGVMTCSQELSASLTARIKELRPLMNREGFLKIPFALRGQYPNVSVRPDIEGILKRGAASAITEGLGKELEGVLGDFLGGGRR